MKLFIVLCFFGVSFSGLVLADNQLSLIQDVLNAKTKKAIAFSQIKISENELRRREALHEQYKALKGNYATAISENEWRKSETDVLSAKFSLLEMNAIYESVSAEVEAHEKQLNAFSGEPVTKKQISEQYLAIWSGRNKAAQYAMKKNEAELAFALFERSQIEKLVETNSASEKEFIEAKHNVIKEEESLARAKELVSVTEEAMKKFK